MHNSVEVSDRPLCSSRVTVKLSAGVPVSVGSQLKLAASFHGRNDRECRVLLCFIFLFLLLSMLFCFEGTCCCCMFALVFLYYLLLFSCHLIFFVQPIHLCVLQKLLWVFAVAGGGVAFISIINTKHRTLTPGQSVWLNLHLLFFHRCDQWQVCNPSVESRELGA